MLERLQYSLAWFSIPMLISVILMIYGIIFISKNNVAFIAGFMNLILLCIFVVAYYGAREYIEITDQYLIYDNYETFFDQLHDIICLLQKKPIQPFVTVLIDDIECVSLLYRSTYMFGLWGYALVLEFHMKDGTVISMCPQSLFSKNGVYIEALDYLEKLGVTVIDKYHLKPGLISNSQYFQEYLKKEKERHD